MRRVHQRRALLGKRSVWGKRGIIAGCAEKIADWAMRNVQKATQERCILQDSPWAHGIGACAGNSRSKATCAAAAGVTSCCGVSFVRIAVDDGTYDPCVMWTSVGKKEIVCVVMVPHFSWVYSVLAQRFQWPSCSSGVVPAECARLQCKSWRCPARSGQRCRHPRTRCFREEYAGRFRSA